MFDALADRLGEAYGEEELLLIGFAETATAIGARLAVRLQTRYIQTTREQVPDAEYLLFLESHSHAAEQKLVQNGLSEILDEVSRVVFVEDEVTTGNTILNIINVLEREFPGKARFAVASILNGMDEAAEAVYREREIGLLYLVKTEHARYEGIAERYAGDGRYVAADGLPDGCAEDVKCYEVRGYLNTRRCVQGEAYEDACRFFWEQIRGCIGIDSGRRILVLGTEEFMYLALFVGKRLEECGNMVKCHATTRSPIVVSSEEDYPVRCRYELESFYGEGRRTFVYDLGKYDSVWILTDAWPVREEGIFSLVNALRSCGNEDIRVVCWR